MVRGASWATSHASILTPHMTDPLDMQTFVRLVHCFHKLGWTVEADLANENDEELLERFSRLLEHLDKKERALVLTLLRRFRRVPLLKYRLMFKDLVAPLMATIAPTSTRIVVAPLLSPCDYYRHKLKSSHMAARVFGLLLKQYTRGSSTSVETASDPATLAAFKLSSTSVVVLVDDFVGSGDTASYAIRFAECSTQSFGTGIRVVCGVAQEQGVRAVKSRTGVDVIAGEVRQRAISDDATLATDGSKETMEAIERRMKVSERYRFGFAQSEALVTFDRIANNTFPVFWWSPRHIAEWEAPWIRN